MNEITTKQHSSSHLFKLASFKSIKKIKNRQNCKICGRKRMYFCYNCRIYIGDVGDYVPKLELPFNVDIIKHRLENDGKSTAIHAILLAPKQTRIFDNFIDVPEYSQEGTVILCPSQTSISLNQYLSTFGQIKRLIVLDSTWNTIGTLKNLVQLKRLPWVHLCNYSTDYWRPQKGFSSEYLATIEAIYFACKEYNNIEILKKEEEGEEKGSIEEQQNCCFDDLLFWFYFFKEEKLMKLNNN